MQDNPTKEGKSWVRRRKKKPASFVVMGKFTRFVVVAICFLVLGLVGRAMTQTAGSAAPDAAQEAAAPAASGAATPAHSIIQPLFQRAAGTVAVPAGSSTRDTVRDADNQHIAQLKFHNPLQQSVHQDPGSAWHLQQSHERLR